MKTKQMGFTLIELVVVLVLLGILGAVASSRFQDLSVRAQEAATDGVAAEISGGLKLNYAARTLDTAVPKTVGFAVTGANAAVCTDATMNQFLDGITLAGGTDYSVTGGAGNCVAAGDTFTCTLNGPGAATADINGICIP